MAAFTPIQAIEAFHLVFLRVLETRVRREAWIVKGGVNLRAWFGSARYSEDMDLDVAVELKAHSLRETIDKLLASPPFAGLLRTQALTLVRSSKPKQTDTTQRWKFEIQTPASTVPLHTKVEFSRRGIDEKHILEPVRPEIVRPYGIPAPTANHYTAAAAICQKIGALAGRREAQARDIWDLEHLFRTTSADPRPLLPKLREAVPIAIERLMDMPYQDFKAQVVPFLEPEHQSLYATVESWDRIRELVLDRLMEMAQ